MARVTRKRRVVAHTIDPIVWQALKTANAADGIKTSRAVEQAILEYLQRRQRRETTS